MDEIIVDTSKMVGTSKPLGKIVEIRIDDFDDLMKVVAYQPKDSNGRYRGTFLYRGLSNSSYKLETTLQRNCKGVDLEDALLRNFAKYTAIEQAKEGDSVWRNMILGQHHGLPTRLLDWSHSPLAALHFATSDSNWEKMDEHDCIMWRINASELYNKLPDEIKHSTHGAQILSVDMLNNATNTIKEYDDKIQNKSMVILEPPSIEPRIVNQYAFFSVVPKKIDDIEDFLINNTEDTVKYVISKDLKWRIRDFLDEANISERTIYPGLDGICKWLARHYYVKDK